MCYYLLLVVDGLMQRPYEFHVVVLVLVDDFDHPLPQGCAFLSDLRGCHYLVNYTPVLADMDPWVLVSCNVH